MKIIDRPAFAELLEEARIKPRIKRDLRYIPEEISNWETRDFITATNKSHSEGVLIAPLERLYVAQFQLQMRKPNKAGRVEAIICDLCATWQRGSNSAVISFLRSDRSSVSFLCCADLDCSLHVRNMTAASKISRAQLRENNTIEQRVQRLTDKLSFILSGI